MKPVVWHPHPLRDDANDEAYVLIYGRGDEVEVLPIRRDGDSHRAIICAAPFFAYGYSLDDEVEVRDDGFIGPIVERSDTFTYRIILDSRNEDDLTEDEIKFLVSRCKSATEELTRLGYLLEWHSPSYGAVVAKGETAANRLVELLDRKEATGDWMWESGG